ncbi:hypothetical protein BC833DRAFT_605173 [Globomyces pollinis-pini]|nr:hypothetical protein BC833DRAFT_605173 [Globomyces pollinis-pini]
MLSIFVSLLALVNSTPVDKRSNYPPDYVAIQNCKDVGPVTACAWNKGYNHPRLYIKYKDSGSLWPKASPLSAYVKVNGKDITTKHFTGSSQNAGDAINYAYYAVGAPANVHMCYHATKTDAPDFTMYGFPRCPVTEQFPLQEGPSPGYVGWFYAPGFANEKALITNAGNYDWNVEIAFVNDKGDWDSLYGQNYRFTL